MYSKEVSHSKSGLKGMRRFLRGRHVKITPRWGIFIITATFSLPFFLHLLKLNLWTRLMKTHINWRAFGGTKTKLSQRDIQVLKNCSVKSKEFEASTVIVTAATKNYLHLVQNLKCSVKAVANKDVVVAALDSEVIEMLRRHNIPFLDSFHSENLYKSFDASDFGSRSFNFVSKIKLRIVLQILKSGHNVIFTDVDVIWCKNFIRELELYSKKYAEIVIQNDSPREKRSLNLNTGFYFAESNEGVVRFFENLVEYAENKKNKNLNDQTAFIKEACKNENGENWKYVREDGTFVRACRWAKSVDIVTLPFSKYLNGNAFLNNRSIHERSGKVLKRMCKTGTICIWHNNWCRSSAKIKRFKKYGMWMPVGNDKCRRIYTNENGSLT